jgi:two-component system, NtrC family, response regulator AtoC
MSDGRTGSLNAGKGRVFVVDDDPDMCALLEARLEARGFEVRSMTSPEAALDHLGSAEVDVVLTDLKMADLDGLQLCERLVARRPDVPVLVMTAFGTVETAIAAIRKGAYDFITKPVDLDALMVALARALEHRALRTEVERLRRVTGAAPGFGDLLGESVVMQQLYELLERVATSDATVLVTGESGTGKELVARELHRRSGRAAAPFVAVNCAAIPDALLESELFGHARGAFTDAQRARTGLIQQANGGTLFLDEIADLPRVLQPKLLRALQERTVRPVGADEEMPFDVRFVAATNRDLEAAVEEGRLREDLYFRLNVIPIAIPPLRARGTDVLLLAQRFVDHHAARARKAVSGISAAAAQRLLAYPWPGNVRELQNCMERAVALTMEGQIDVGDLPESVRVYDRSQVVLTATDPSQLGTLEEIELRYIQRVIETVGGHRAKAARILGLDRKTLYRKLTRAERTPRRRAQRAP